MVVLPLLFLPPVTWFVEAFHAGGIVLEGHENYQRQTFRSRASVLSAQGVETVSFPVIKGRSHQPIRTTKIDNSVSWKRKLWQTLTTNYNASPYFQYYTEELKTALFFEEDSLYAYNLNWLTVCLDLLQTNLTIEHTANYQKEYDAPLLDGRRVFGSKRIAGTIDAIPYTQVFGEAFYPDLSILDLIACEGPAAIQIILNQKPILT